MATQLTTVPSGGTPFLMDNPIFDADQFATMMQVADIMSKAKLVPEHLQGKPADCLLVVEQARRWNMSPFAVAQETYLVKQKLLFGGKLVTAVINTRAPVKHSLRFSYSGEGDKCEVTVSATLRGEDEPREYSITIGEAKAVAGTSSLWKTDPKQQAAYFAARFWARRHCPEVILGVWGEDEIDAAPVMRDVTPTPADIRRAAPPPADLLALVDTDGEEFLLNPVEVPGRLADWCREATDEALPLLIENNPGVELVAEAVAAEQKRRADPLRLAGLGRKEFCEALSLGLERVPNVVELDRLWVLYEDRARAHSVVYADKISAYVADCIASKAGGEAG